MEYISDSVPDPDNTSIKSTYDDEIDQIFELFHSYNDDNILDVDIHMLQYLLVISASSGFYTVSIVFFQKHGGANSGDTNCMCHFSISLLIKANVKLANGNMTHAQVICIILLCFINLHIIYPVGPVYYSTSHPFNTISLGAFKYYVCLKILSEPLGRCDCGYMQDYYWKSPYRTQNNLDYLQLDIPKSTLNEI